jgi:hypothetical protein
MTYYWAFEIPRLHCFDKYMLAEYIVLTIVNSPSSEDPQECTQGSLDDGYAYAHWDDYEEASRAAATSYGGWDD